MTPDQVFKTHFLSLDENINSAGISRRCQTISQTTEIKKERKKKEIHIWQDSYCTKDYVEDHLYNWCYILLW